MCCDGEGGDFFFAALLFVRWRVELLLELRDALLLAVVEASGLLEVGVGVAAALFEAGECGGGCAGGLLQLFAAGAEAADPCL